MTWRNLTGLVCPFQVRMAAFQALGGFISTFADPDVTGIYLNEDGVLIAGNLDDKRYA